MPDLAVALFVGMVMGFILGFYICYSGWVIGRTVKIAKKDKQ